jgi:hypothetical protein
MSGRRSKGASASVSTPPIADSSDVWTDESKLLKPVDKKRPDSEWPIFQLDDAIVLDRNGEFVVNLLLVERRGPFVFRGRLNDLKGDKYKAARELSRPRALRRLANYAKSSTPRTSLQQST